MVSMIAAQWRGRALFSFVARLDLVLWVVGTVVELGVFLTGIVWSKRYVIYCRE